MKRTFIIAIIALLALIPQANAQQITVHAPDQVYAGENFTVTFSVNDKAQDFRGPSFKGFSLRSGPNQDFQQVTTFSNGQWTQSIQTSISYRLLADVEGTFTIGPATCTVDGKKISSQSFSIKVVKLSQSQQQQRQQQANQQRRQAYDPWDQAPQAPSEISEKNLFARATLSNSNPYQGEQVIITYKVYTQVPLSQVGIDKLPGNKGFWAEDLSANKQIKQSEETINGQPYRVYEIRRGALFAQESGKLTIDPLSLDVLAVVQAKRRRTGSLLDLFDDPFFNMAQPQEYTLRTKSLPVNVKPLPQPPDNFSGAVGSFTLKGGLNMQKAKSNEAISYRLTISGSGNLMLVTPPTPQFPSSFEVFDPQITDNLTHSDNGISGSRTFEWVVIPRNPGSFTIPEYNFLYFDPSSSRYVTLTIPAQTIEVAQGKNSAASNSDNLQTLNRDINYIHPLGKLHPLAHKAHTPLLFYLLLAAIPLLALVVLVIGKKQQAQQQDVASLRSKRATRIARRRLKKAAALLSSDDTNRFYEEIYRAIWGALADKYSIPLSLLNRDSVASTLADKQVPAEQQERIMQLLHDVDLARFAPGNPEAHKQSIYQQALLMIAAL